MLEELSKINEIVVQRKKLFKNKIKKVVWRCSSVTKENDIDNKNQFKSNELF